MALDRSTDSPGGFQVRHRILGVFQGSSIGLAFWHPSSHMPEYGLCRFATEAKAQSYVDYLSSPTCPERFITTDLTVEAFDHAEHERLTTEYPQTRHGKHHCSRMLTMIAAYSRMRHGRSRVASFTWSD